MRFRLPVLLLLAIGLASALAGAARAQNRFSLVNSTGEVIERAYVSPARQGAWGPDLLGQAVLAPGQSVWLVPPFADCVLDIRVVFRGGREETRPQVNACTLTQVVWGGALAGLGDPSFRFVNATGLMIRELYVSLSSDGRWGPDRLGTSLLAAGAAFDVTLPAGKVCAVDIRVVFDNGASVERRRVETCSVRVLNFR